MHVYTYFKANVATLALFFATSLLTMFSSNFRIKDCSTIR